MLDKSVPFADVLMCRRKGTPVIHTPLPDGYSFSLYSPGDEADWARIETAVLEFKSEAEALAYFEKSFLSFASETSRRCVFVKDAAGKKAATGSAWWNQTGERRDPWVHWIAVSPEYQGLGLGKAIVSKVIRMLIDIEGDRDIYLKTQTWSHKAVGIYEKAGFFVTDEKNIHAYKNDDYEKAVEILKSVK